MEPRPAGTQAIGATASGHGWRLLFWTVFARSKNPMALLAQDRRIVAVNQAAVALSEYTRAELIGRSVDTLLVPEEWQSLDAEWRELRRRGDFEGERAFLTASGQRIEAQYALRSARLDSRAVALLVVLEANREPVRLRTPHAALAGELSPRELEIVSHVAMGQRAHEIAQELGIAESTVRTHIRNALRKAGARSQAQLVARVCSGDVPAASIPA
jgi:PAS domain S-box-containing protein